MPVVVLDTNILLQDPLVKGAHLEKLLVACRKCGYEVVIPGVVRDELLGNFKEKLQQAASSVTSLQRKLESLGIEQEAKPVDIDRELSRYEKHLGAVAEMYGVAMSGYPVTTAQELVKASYVGKKPFKATGGTGWKDKLVWDSTKASVAAAEDKKGFLLTENRTDFCNSDGGLHPDLAGDLPEGVGIDVAISAKAFYDNHLAPLLAPLKDADAVRGAILKGKFVGFNLGSELEILVTRLLETSGRDFDHLQTPLNDTSFHSLQSLDPDDIDVGQLDEKLLSIDVAGDLELEIVGFIDKSDYFGEHDNSRIHVLDGDWNDHVMMCASVTSARFRLSIIFNQDTHEIESSDIEIDRPDDSF